MPEASWYAGMITDTAVRSFVVGDTARECRDGAGYEPRIREGSRGA
jgi:hypothetical protein